MFKSPSKAAARSSSFSLLPEDIQVNTEDRRNYLGKGGFGVVYKGSYNLAPAAIKELLVPDLSARGLKEFTQEAEIMASLHHPHIIQLYGFIEVAPYRIVMEFMPKGSLYQVLSGEEDISWAKRITWGIEIGAGLHYLHTRSPTIIHRDLKSLNVLMSKDNQAKLTDFGLAFAKLRTTTATLTSSSKAKKTEEQPTGAVGSTRWMAPELFAELEPSYNQATDIFAYAIVLWEIAAREIPYANVRADSIIEDAIQHGKRATIQTDWPDAFKTLIARAWDQTPSKRPSAQQAVETLQKALDEFTVEDSRQSLAKTTLKPPVESRGYAFASEAEKKTQSGYALASEAPKLPPRPIAKKPSTSPDKEKSPVTALFAPKPAEKLPVKQADVEALLLHVARGEQDEAEAMLKKNKNLLLHKGKVTDYSNRTFNNITAFQYALWALDWHMWKMILTYLSKDEAARQLQDLENNGTEHNIHYDFTPFIYVLKTYFTSQAVDNYWIENVGHAQTQVPAHIANEYCRPDRSFVPKPSFTEDSLPRIFDLWRDDRFDSHDDNKFFPLVDYSCGALSLNFGIYRGDENAAHSHPHNTWWGLSEGQANNAFPDLSAISSLCEVRTQQYQELKHELTVQLGARPR